MAIDVHGRLDVLVNNVGAVRIRVGGFLGTSDEEFEWALEMNFFAGLRATRAALVRCSSKFWVDRERCFDQLVLSARRGDRRLRRGQGRGRQSGQVALAGVRAEGNPRELRLPRAGEHGSMARRARRRRYVRDATGIDADTIRASATAAIATGWFTTPQEVAALVTLLASDRIANVTGVNYVIDGGLVKTT